MRKTFLSYLMVIMITFVVGVSMVEAADYNYKIKAYRVEDPYSFYMDEDLDISSYEEISANDIVVPGETIAVAVCEINRTNVNGGAFDLELKWDSDVLVPWERNGRAFSIGLAPGLSSTSSNYYENDLAIIARESYKGYTVGGENILFWVFFNVKDDVKNNVLFTFSFKKAEKVFDYGYKLADVTTTPITFKVFKKNIQDNLLGDVNKNGRIDFGDIALVTLYVGKEITFTTEEKAVADLNSDGYVNLRDQIELIKLYKNESY